MAHSNRQQTDPLKKSLLDRPKQYGYFQAIRLLRRIAGSDRPFEDFLRDQVRIRPPVSLGFADVDVRDIRDISTQDATRFEITGNFLGLYGPASPLPTYYTEELIEEEQDEESVKRDFMDILNDPFFKLFYQCWSKYRLPVKLVDENDSSYYQRIYSLLGMAEPELRDRLPESRALLRYAGLFMCKPRSAMGLKTLIADFFQLPGVDIEQCVELQVTIDFDQQCLLGRQACVLGEDSHIGTQILDYSSKIRINCGPLDRDMFHSLLPGTDKFEELVRVINVYLDQPLSVDVRLIVNKEEIQTATLGESQWSMLGYNTWLRTENGSTVELEPYASYGLQTDSA